VIAGQNAETARVDGNGLVDAEFGREVTAGDPEWF